MADSNFLKVIFHDAEKHCWKHLEDMFKSRDKKSLGDFLVRRAEDHTNRTILHYACDSGDSKHVKEGVKLILKYLTRTSCTHDRFKSFINSKDWHSDTALDIATRWGHEDVVDLLIEKGADITIRFDPKMNGLYFKILLKALDNGLFLEANEYDKTNEYLWSVKCDFGILEKCNIGKTELLAKILDLPRARRRKIVLHPLVQLYFHDKWENFKWLRRCSNFLHFTWYLMSAIFILGSLANFNSSKKVDNNAPIQVASQTWFCILVTIFCVMFSYKQGLKFWISPSKKFTLRQFQNWGQLAVLLGIVTTTLSRFLLYCFGYGFSQLPGFIQFLLCLLYIIGLIASIFLIQSLSTSTDGGMYNHMMIKSFQRLIHFILAFGQLFIAYAIIFNTLHPDDVTFSLSWSTMFVGIPKQLTMQNGETNFKDVITKENINQIPFVIPTVAVYFSFIVVVVILLNNLWVGFAVVDTEKSRRKAIAAHAASCLEQLFIMEAFILDRQFASFLHMIGKKDWFMQKLFMAPSPIKDSLLPKGFSSYFPFVKIPKQIRKGIYKISSILPSGYVADE